MGVASSFSQCHGVSWTNTLFILFVSFKPAFIIRLNYKPEGGVSYREAGTLGLLV